MRLFVSHTNNQRMSLHYFGVGQRLLARRRRELSPENPALLCQQVARDRRRLAVYRSPSAPRLLATIRLMDWLLVGS